MERVAADRAHLDGYDFTKSPRFRWRNESVPEKPRVLIQTAIGDIEVELDRNTAPITVTNFLYYVHEGLFSDGGFHRTVTAGESADELGEDSGDSSRREPGEVE
ncbi:MAG: peptidylprolyl isomerase [Verrucomicrobia bacterium]|nr:peptidylprolyl isomerase [Verrucomicrobiota bacterium]